MGIGGSTSVFSILQRLKSKGTLGSFLSLVHHYLAVEEDYDNFLSIGKGLFEMLKDIDLVEFSELKEILKGI